MTLLNRVSDAASIVATVVRPFIAVELPHPLLTPKQEGRSVALNGEPANAFAVEYTFVGVEVRVVPEESAVRIVTPVQRHFVGVPHPSLSRHARLCRRPASSFVPYVEPSEPALSEKLLCPSSMAAASSDFRRRCDGSFKVVPTAVGTMSERTFRERLMDGETVVGTFQLLDSPMVSEMIGVAGMDFTILDQEHGPLTAETSVGLCAASENGGASPIVRVRNNTESEIQRALDIGAAGVEIPQIETRDDAEAAVEHARFDPLGSRGLSPYVRAGGYTGGPDYTETQNEEVTVIVHIEGKAGVENLDEILAVEGIDVLFLGPYDLSQSLGIPGQVRDQQVESLMREVCDRAAERGKVVGTFADDAEMANEWIEAGVQYIAMRVDGAILTDAFADTIAGVDR